MLFEKHTIPNISAQECPYLKDTNFFKPSVGHFKTTIFLSIHTNNFCTDAQKTVPSSLESTL